MKMGDATYGEMNFAYLTGLLTFSLGGKTGGVMAYIDGANGYFWAKVHSGFSAKIPSLTVDTHAYIEDSEQYYSYIWIAEGLDWSAASIKGMSGFLNSLTVGTVFSAASYKNSPKFPTPYYSAPGNITAYSQGPNAVSAIAVPDANYSGFIVGAISGKCRTGHDAPVLCAIYAYLDNGTAITLFADSAESHNWLPMLLTDWSVMASCNDQPGRYIAKLMFYATIADSGHLSTEWSSEGIWAYQF